MKNKSGIANSIAWEFAHWSKLSRGWKGDKLKMRGTVNVEEALAAIERMRKGERELPPNKT